MFSRESLIKSLRNEGYTNKVSNFVATHACSTLKFGKVTESIEQEQAIKSVATVASMRYGLNTEDIEKSIKNAIS